MCKLCNDTGWITINGFPFPCPCKLQQPRSQQWSCKKNCKTVADCNGSCKS